MSWCKGENIWNHGRHSWRCNFYNLSSYIRLGLCDIMTCWRLRHQLYDLRNKRRWKMIHSHQWDGRETPKTAYFLIWGGWERKQLEMSLKAWFWSNLYLRTSNRRDWDGESYFSECMVIRQHRRAYITGVAEVVCNPSPSHLRRLPFPKTNVSTAASGNRDSAVFPNLCFQHKWSVWKSYICWLCSMRGES